MTRSIALESKAISPVFRSGKRLKVISLSRISALFESKVPEVSTEEVALNNTFSATKLGTT